MLELLGIHVGYKEEEHPGELEAYSLNTDASWPNMTRNFMAQLQDLMAPLYRGVRAMESFGDW